MKKKIKNICCTISGEEECMPSDCWLVFIAFSFIAGLWITYLIR